MSDCIVCEGTGYVRVDDFDGQGVFQVCERCDGSGEGGTRVRMELDGGHMDVTLKAGASPETIAALRELGQAAVASLAAASPLSEETNET